MPTTAYISLGSNVGDRMETLTAAIFALHDSDGVAVVDISGIYETAPWGGVEQAPFLNAVAKVLTTLDAHALLGELQTTEAAFGRDRSREQRWGPRILDLDLLLYGDEVIDSEDLEVPHPRLDERPFVLIPLMEVMPGGQLPDGRRLARLLNELAPVEGVELVLRLEEVPGGRPPRPEGPGSPGAFLADEFDASRRRAAGQATEEQP